MSYLSELERPKAPGCAPWVPVGGECSEYGGTNVWFVLTRRFKRDRDRARCTTQLLEVCMALIPHPLDVPRRSRPVPSVRVTAETGADGVGYACQVQAVQRRILGSVISDSNFSS